MHLEDVREWQRQRCADLAQRRRAPAALRAALDDAAVSRLSGILEVFHDPPPPLPLPLPYAWHCGTERQRASREGFAATCSRQTPRPPALVAPQAPVFTADV